MQTIIAVLHQHGLLAVFASVFIEGLGLPLPSYPWLIVAAALLPSATYSSGELLGVALVANLLPDAVWYEAGRRYGTRIMGALCKMSLSPDSCARGSSDLFARLGPPSLAFIKFIPGFSNLGIVLSGATRLRLAIFSFYDGIGALIYIGLPLGLGIVFRNAVGSVLARFDQIGRWGLIVLGGMLALYVLGKYAQRRWLIHRLRMDRITVEELSILLQREQRPIVLDVRSAAQRKLDGMIPGAVYADPAKLDVTIEKPENGREIVVYCACPNEISAAKLALRLRKLGFRNIRPLLGGIEAWRRAGYTVERAGDGEMPVPLAA